MQTQSICVTANHSFAKKKIENILALATITLNNLEGLDSYGRHKLSLATRKILNRLKGDRRDAFLAKIAPILAAESRSHLWETNHLNISAAITSYIRDYGVMPANT